MTWYLRREWVDQEAGIENVMIHYTWSPPGGWPNWEHGHNSRVLVSTGGFPNVRRKVLKMPPGIWDQSGSFSHDYRFHYFFEVFQNGTSRTTDLISEDIVSREMEYVDSDGWVTNICVYWGAYDWEAPVYSPMEDPRFPPDSEFTSRRYYTYWDKDRYHYSKTQMLARIPTPHHWRTTIWGPRGARVVQQFHIGRLYPPEARYETWLGPDGPGNPGESYWVFEL